MLLEIPVPGTASIREGIKALLVGRVAAAREILLEEVRRGGIGSILAAHGHRPTTGRASGSLICPALSILRRLCAAFESRDDRPQRKAPPKRGPSCEGRPSGGVPARPVNSLSEPRGAPVIGPCDSPG